ncbi:hypothetical protein AQUCO_00300074v1 [Aquilegia coerulea]|uniref:Factor of DNA methylation 1-5/IDN2 domain-containing protein n=1 Tax=Aquilegia coerulea TaxID=218851 RepID=A0A2G5EX32_AQUCA|nr:hypothetical protein AQUCO_00300074v1 [Aquilegia coerulea]
MLPIFLLPCKARSIDPKYVDLAENLDEFDSFPWGTAVFNLLEKSLHQVYEDYVVAKKTTFSIHGCVICFIVWAYLYIPSLGPRRIANAPFPRILGSEDLPGKNISLATIEAKLHPDKDQLDVFESLTITEEEKNQAVVAEALQVCYNSQIQNYFVQIQNTKNEHQLARAELLVAKEKNIQFETTSNEWKNTNEKLKVESENHEKASKLANAQLQVARTDLITIKEKNNDLATTAKRLRAERDEVGNIPGTLRESYSRCVQENRQLKMEVGTQRMKLESCQDQSRLNQKKLNDEIKELKTRLYEMDGNLDMLSKQLEDKNDDMQHMESLNQVLMLKERINNSELQEARIELKSSLENVLSQHSLFGIKRMGELNSKPFRDVCMQKFSGEDLESVSIELCSLWHENEIIDDSDDKLKQLKDDWGEQVYKAVCVALSEINEYNPSTRCAVPEIWNFKEDRKASLKEVIGFLLKELNALEKAKHR